jgi:hypothetical protein
MQAKRGEAGDGSGEYFVLEMRIFHVIDDKDGTGNKICDDVSDVYKDKHPSTPGNIKSLVMTLFGCGEDDVNKELLQFLVSDQQPLAGFCCEYKAWQKPTRKIGEDGKRGVYTVKRYVRLVPAQEVMALLEDRPDVLQKCFGGPKALQELATMEEALAKQMSGG